MLGRALPPAAGLLFSLCAFCAASPDRARSPGFAPLVSAAASGASFANAPLFVSPAAVSPAARPPAAASTPTDAAAAPIAAEAIARPFSNPGPENRVRGVFLELLESAKAGRVPNVIIDFDDTLTRTAPRYVKAIEHLDDRFGLGIAGGGRAVRESDIRYTNSFPGTAKATLAALGIPRRRIEAIFAKKGRQRVSPAEKEFAKIFFDPALIASDPVYPGVVDFFSGLLRVAQALNGRVIVASGRAEKFKELTKRSLVNAGVPEELLEGRHIVWYLRPAEGRSVESDVRLNFHNNKSRLVSEIARIPNNEVAAVIDNEFRNIVQFINLVPARRLFYFKSTDATWSHPDMRRLLEVLEADLGAERIGYTPFRSFAAHGGITRRPHPAPAEDKRVAIDPDALRDIDIFQWLTPAQAARLAAGRSARLDDELADLLLYLSKLGAWFGVDLIEPALAAMDKNRPSTEIQ